jgi:hypothetical protein
MTRRCAWVVVAVAYVPACVAFGQNAVGAIGSNGTAQIAKPQPTQAEAPSPREPQRPGNPLWRIPVDSLSVTRERPLFSSSRRPPPPPPPSMPPPSNAASSAPAEPEPPPLLLQGTAIGKPRDIALVLDEAAKSSVSLRVGEATEGWYLRSVDRQAVTLEKDRRIVVLSLPPPGAAPLNPPALVSDRSDQPNMRHDARPRSKNGGDWIAKSHALY